MNIHRNTEQYCLHGVFTSYIHVKATFHINYIIYSIYPMFQWIIYYKGNPNIFQEVFN
jgi:hypothetical protein